MDDEPRTAAPLVDAAELLGLLVLPALALGLGVAALAGPQNLVPAMAVGGVFGLVLVGLRRGFRAVRTPDGIERRPRSVEDSSGNPWVRAASVEYDERYDRVLAVVLAVVGIAAFAAIPVLEPGGWLVVRLLAAGLFGVVASLLVVGLRWG